MIRSSCAGYAKNAMNDALVVNRGATLDARIIAARRPRQHPHQPADLEAVSEDGEVKVCHESVPHRQGLFARHYSMVGGCAEPLGRSRGIQPAPRHHLRPPRTRLFARHYSPLILSCTRSILHLERPACQEKLLHEFTRYIIGQVCKIPGEMKSHHKSHSIRTKRSQGLLRRLLDPQPRLRRKKPQNIAWRNFEIARTLQDFEDDFRRRRLIWSA